MADSKKTDAPVGRFAAFKRLPFYAKLFAVAFLVMSASEYFLLSYVWDTRLDYTFGYLVPIFSLYVIYDRSDKMLGILRPASIGETEGVFARGFADLFFGSMLFCGLVFYLFFAWFFYMTQNRGAPAFSMTFGFSFASYAMAYFASARSVDGSPLPLKSRLQFTALFTFPCFIWILSAPPIGTVEEKISLFLLGIVANVVYAIMDALGYVVQLRGNVIDFPGGSVGVAEACSGIRSLMACLFAGSFLAAIMLDKLWKKIALVILSMFFAFFNNILRALFLSFWAYENGSESISGFVHDAAGYFVLGTTIIGLLLFVALFQLNPVPEEFREKSGNP